MVTYVKAVDMAKILGIQKSSMYYILHPEKKKEVAIKKAIKENREINNLEYKKINYVKYGREVMIDVDSFMNEHKVYNFKFIHEKENGSFLDRLKVSADINTLPEYINTANVRIIYPFNTYQLKKHRLERNIKYKTIEDQRYPETAKGYRQYLYHKKSILQYLDKKNIPLEPYYIYNYTCQFYTPREAQEYILNRYNTKVSLPTICRRINNNEIPAIKVGNLLKIPILEFERLNFKNIFNIKE